MATEILQNRKEINRIWMWKHLSEVPATPIADVTLPDGALYEADTPLKVIGENMYMTVVLPNCDLVYGPRLEKSESAAPDNNELIRRKAMRKEFQTDMVYLKHAILSRTIILDNLGD